MSAKAICPSPSPDATYEYIDSVEIDGMYLESANNRGYGDFTAMPVDLAKRHFPLELTPGYHGYAFNQTWSVWIDLDGNQTFSADERVFISTSNTRISTEITLPTSTPSGSIDMRIVMSYSNSPTDACSEFAYGEVEDYRLVVPERHAEQTIVSQPWQDIAPQDTVTGIGWRYAMGYHFTPQTDGHITGLGGLFTGTKTVRLYRRETGEKLAEVAVTGNGSWSYSPLAQPVSVDKDSAYTVAVYLNGAGGTYQYGTPLPFPVSSGGVTITSATYLHTGSENDPERPPTNEYHYAMLGVADVQFKQTVQHSFSVACEEDAPSQTEQGTMTIGPVGDLLPLCNGLVVLGDRTEKALKVLDVSQQRVLATYPFEGVPGAMVADAASNRVYVALESPAGIASVSLEDGSVDTLSLNHPKLANPTLVYDLEMIEGALVAIVQDGARYYWTQRPVVRFDVDSGSITHVLDLSANGRGATLLAYDHVTSRLIVADEGSSPSSITAYALDDGTLTEVDYRWNAGANGHDLSVSSDGLHLAFACGGGNDAGYTTFDLHPNDLNNVNGEWHIGAYPTSAQFSPDASLLGATNGTELLVFDVLSKSLVFDVTPEIEGCDYQTLHRVRFSAGGHRLFGVTNCGFDDDSGRLVWTTVPSP